MKEGEPMLYREPTENER